MFAEGPLGLCAAVSRPLAILAALALAAVPAGCGDTPEQADTGPVPTESRSDTSPQATNTGAIPPATTTEAPAGNEKDLSTKPKVKAPEGKPPTQLKIRDIVKGKGPGAEPGDTLTVQYVGVSASNGKEFDASWDRGEPFTFGLGRGEVIPGWDAGLDGMKKGGRRELVIPADKAYGPSGQPPTIGPNETLVFVIDLKKIG